VIPVRRFARWARLVLAALFLIGIVVQFVTIGIGLFPDREGLDVHEGLGWTIMHLLPLLILVVGLIAWRPTEDLVLSVVVGVLGIVQPFLAGGGGWWGAFHPVNALALFVLTQLIVRRDWRALRAPALPAAGQTAAAGDLPAR